MIRRIAVSRLILPERVILKNQVLEWSSPDILPIYYPLTSELHSTPWYKGTYDLLSQQFV
jgi:hypothetical protein